MEQWVVELDGDGTVRARDGVLIIDVRGGCTVWFRHRLEGPVRISYEVTVVDQGGPNDRVSDLNCFWMFTDPRAEDGDFFSVRRSGRFEDYHRMRGYYVGLGGNRNRTTRFRRYIGERNRPLLPEHDLRDPRHMITANRRQRIELVADGPTIRYLRDGEVVFDVADDAPYREGYFGFRTVHNHMRIERFRVHALRADEPADAADSGPADDPAGGRIPAFPEAEGFGRYARGGRGGDVYYVTHLDDAGPGSLRHGIQTADGPRTILFAVSGTIALESELVVDRPFITIAGQTAPGDGITLRNDQLRIRADHIIVRFIRSRMGDLGGHGRSPIRIEAGRNIILDHVSASWGINETLSTSSPVYESVRESEPGDIDLITTQWSIISEGLYAPRTRFMGRTNRAFGTVVRGRRETLHHNLYAHHNYRSPKVAWRSHSLADIRNNVIYNAPSAANHDASNDFVNWVGNYYKPGPNTGDPRPYVIFELWNRAPDRRAAEMGEHHRFDPRLYIAGNVVEGYPEITRDNHTGVRFRHGANADMLVDRPHEVSAIRRQRPAEDAYEAVLRFAGASRTRDSVDERIVEEVRTGTARFGNRGIIDSQEDVGGWPELRSEPAPKDSDGDGIPDEWKRQHGLQVGDPEEGNRDRNGDGYTNLEEYLNSLVRHLYGPDEADDQE